MPDFGLSQPQEEEENAQEAAGRVPFLNLNPPTVRKKRRLKPTSDVRPKLPVLTENEPLVSPSRDPTQEPAEPLDQEEPLETNLQPPDHDDDPVQPLPELTPPRTASQQIPPDPPVGDDFSTPTPPHTMKNAKKLGPIPRLESSHFKPYLEAAETTSVIDEFSPKKSFPTQDTIELSVQDSQVRRNVTQPSNGSFEPTPADDPLDEDIAQKMQDAEDAYLDLDGQANGIETSNDEQPTTVSNAGLSILTLFLLTNRRTLILWSMSRSDPSRLQKVRTRLSRSVRLSPVSNNRTNEPHLGTVVERSEAGRRSSSSKPEVRRD